MEASTSYFAMGGYGAYVWPSYVLAAVLMLVILLLSWRAARRAEAQLKAMQAMRPERAARASQPEEV